MYGLDEIYGNLQTPRDYNAMFVNLSISEIIEKIKSDCNMFHNEYPNEEQIANCLLEIKTHEETCTNEFKYWIIENVDARNDVLETYKNFKNENGYVDTIPCPFSNEKYYNL